MASSSDGMSDWRAEGDQSEAACTLDTVQQELPNTPKSRSRNPSGDTPKSGANGKLEALSREDLIKFVKKQMVLLQRTKIKCEELNKEVGVLKTAPQKGDLESELKALRDELGEVKEDRDNAMAAYTSAQQAQEATAEQIKAFEEEIAKVTKENKVFKEQIECMVMKDETMTSSFMALQAELDKLEKDKKAMDQEVTVQKEARDQALTALRDLKEQSLNSTTSAEETRVQLEDQREQCSQLRETVAKLQKEKSKLESEHELLASNAKMSDAKITDLLENLTVSSSQSEQFKGDLELSQLSKSQLEKAPEMLRTELMKESEEVKESERLKTQLEQFKLEQATAEQASDEKLTQCTEMLRAAHDQVDLLQKDQGEAQNQLAASSGAKVEELLEENARLRAEAEQLGAQIEEVKDKLLASRAAEEKLEKEGGELRTQLERMGEECAKLRSDCQEFISHKEQLTAEVEQYVKSIELLKQKLEREEAGSKASEDSRKETSSRVEQLESGLRAAYEQMRAAGEKLSDWERLMAMLKDDRDRLESDVVALEERESSSMTELDDLNSSLTEALQERDTLRDQMCRLTEHGGITASIKTLKQTLEDLKFERDELSEKMVSVQEQNEQLTKDTELLNSENEHQAKELQAIKEKQQQVMDEKTQIDTERMKLLVEKDTLVSELSAKESGATSNVVELTDLRERIKNFDAEHEQILVGVEESKRQAEIAREELAKVQKQLSESQMQIESFFPEREMLEHKLADLSAMRRQADVVHEENEQLRSQVTNLSETGNKLTEVKDQTELLEQELATQQGKVDQLQTELQNVEEQRNTITEEVMLVRKENEALTERMKDIENQKNDISKAKEDLKCDFETKLETMEALQNQLHNVKLSLENLEQQNKEAANSQTNQEATLTEKVQSLEMSISEKCTLQQVLEVRLSEAEELTSSLQMQLHDKESEMRKTRKQCDELNHQQQLQLETDLEQSRSECKSLATSSGELTVNLKASQEKLRELGEKHVAVSAEICQLKDLIESMKHGSDNSAQEVTTIKQELALLQGQKAGVEEQLRGSEAGKMQLKEQLQQSVQTVSQLKTGQSQIEEESEMLKRQNREEIENIRAEMEQSSRVQSEMMEVRQKLQAKVDDLGAKIQEDGNQSSAIKTELEQAKADADQMQLKLQGEIKERNSLKEQLISIQSEKASLLSNQQKSADKILELEQKLHQASERVTSLEGDIQDIEKLRRELAEVRDKSENNVSEGNMLRDALSSRVQELEEVRQELLGKEAEISELKQSAKSTQAIQQSAVDREDLRISKLQKDLKEANDKMNKFKQLALKAKKESNDLKSKIEKISSELEHSQKEKGEVALNCQQLQAALDQSDGAAEEINACIQKKIEEVDALQKELADVGEQLETAKAENAEVRDRLGEAGSQREAVDGERVKVGLELEAARIQCEQLSKCKQQLEEEVTRLQEEMKRSEGEHGETVKALQTELGNLHSKLSNAQKEAQQSSMMDLEIADYERTVQTLNEKMAECHTKLKVTEAEVTRQEEKVAALIKQLESAEAQSSAAEDRANKLKQLLVKSKKDLADAKKVESERRTTDAQLQGKLELFNQQSEEHKIQIAGLVTENARLVEKIRGSTASNLRSVRSLELKVASLQGDLDLTKSELNTVQTEYDSYKVRVHNVLKQQKERGPNDGVQQMDKQERKRLEDALDELKNKVQSLSQQLSVTVLDNDMLQEEQNQLHARHTRLLQDLTEKEAEWKARLDHATIDTSTAHKEHEETVHQLTLQNEALTMTFKDQMRSMQEEHRRALEALQLQVERAACQVPCPRPDPPTAKSPPPSESDPDMDGAHRGPLRAEERQAAEGMELPEPETSKRTLMISSQSLIPLEQLLNSPPASPGPMSLEMLDDSMLRSKLAGAQQRIEHLSGLMNESEATVLRLTEQARVLKEEIRRQERNMERNQHIEKAEYLKNIILKFLTLETEDERKQLIPVLVTMLRLSPEEKNTLMFIARGGKEDDEKDASGWSGYLHRWSGLI